MSEQEPRVPRLSTLLIASMCAVEPQGLIL